MAEIACDEVLDLAYDWLCLRRESTSHNNDVWDVRWRAWPAGRWRGASNVSAGFMSKVRMQSASVNTFDAGYAGPSNAPKATRERAFTTCCRGEGGHSWGAAE